MKKFCSFVVIAFLFSMCGCSGYREINHGYLVTAVGIGAEDNQISLIVEVMSSSDIGDQSAERQLLTAEGDTIDTAYTNLKSTLVKPLYYEQLGAVVVENNIDNDMLAFLKKTINNNYGVYVVKCDDINALFDFNSAGSVLGYDIIGLIKNRDKKGKKSSTQFYQIRNSDKPLSTINVENDRLVMND